MSEQEKEILMIPFVKAEADCARYERIICRLIGLIILLIICFTAYIAYDKWQDGQWDYTDEIIEDVDLMGEDGNTNYIKNGGVINNGENQSKDDTQAHEDQTAQEVGG